MTDSFTNSEIQNYKFLINTHLEMMGGKKKELKELENLKKTEQIIKETIGSLDKKNFPQKVKALKILFKIQLKQKKKIYSNVKRVLKMKVTRNKAKLKMDNQKTVVDELKSRFDRTDKALKKYDDVLETMTSDASGIFSKPKKHKAYAALETFEMSQLSDQLKEALVDASSDDAEKLDRSSKRASTAIWSAMRIVKKTAKKHKQLSKILQKSQKTFLKLQAAHQKSRQRVEEGASLVETLVNSYNNLQNEIFTLTDSIKPDVSSDKLVKLVPKITADIQEAAAEASGGYYNNSYDSDYDSDDDDDVFSGGATKSRLYKYGTNVEKLIKSFDKTVKNYDVDTKTRNKTLIDNLGVYGDILVKLSGVGDLVRTYISDAERLQEIASIVSKKINIAMDEWRRTTEDGINKDRKKITDDMEKQGNQKKQEAEASGGFFDFW